MVTIAALSTNASPIGWISDDDSETRGNNVDAHLDRNADDLPDLPRPQGGPGRVFDYPADLTRSPQTYGEAAAVNLFYWCNWMHDRLYELGFDEAAGNYQKDNFGRGGEDNDAIIANAQDGSGVNNARFFPAPDGNPGRIEMFVFDGSDPDRDGDFDAEIILHEYAHGLTDRMVGGGIGIYQLVTVGLAEGWSDFYALAMLNDSSDVDANYTEGAYSTYQFLGLTQNYYYGIRRYPYTTDMSKNPLTFKDIDRAQITPYPSVPRSPIHPFNPNMADEPHRSGELWCVTLWEMRANLIRKHGFPAGNELTLQLVTDGLKLSPPNSTFLQARDAIFVADRLLTGGANQTELWAAFAKRGMGLTATDGPNWTTEGIRQSFDRPDTLTVVPTGGFRFSGPSGGPIDPSCRTLIITNPSASAVSWHLSNPEPYFSISTSSGTLAAGESAFIEVCPALAALDLGVGAHVTPLFVTNLLSGVVQRRDLSIQILQIARAPFFEDFESENLDAFWTTSGAGLARTLLSTNDGPFEGAQHLTFASGGVGLYARNEATLAIDLAGYTNVTLRFWAREFKDRPDGPPPAPFFQSADFDGVAISVDGYAWYEAAGLRRLREDYSEVIVALDETVARHGLAYNGWFRIRFNQAGTMPIPDGGIAIDNVSIAGIAPRRFVLSLPQSVNENAGTVTGQAAVQVAVAPAQNVIVHLSSSNPQLVSVPATVLLPASATSAFFDLTVADDDALDGEQSAIITASAIGYHPGEGRLRIADNESVAL
ncbi:MAG TPA: M36 family metallopeptidase, partial [Bryobacteraceae bacterium]|nr:M36 family metallopeptidase [Bryobacteraceae bacterium]